MFAFIIFKVTLQNTLITLLYFSDLWFCVETLPTIPATSLQTQLDTTVEINVNNINC